MISNSDLLLYRGLHGAAIAGDVDLSQYPDLSIGIAPNANLEWMNKIHHDVRNRHVKREDAQASILKNLDDYVRHITPQFMRTHINFQLIPLVDTANPFTGEPVPSDDECYLIVHVLKQYWPNFVPLLADLQGSFMSRRNTIVIPSSKMLTAIELFLIPIIQDLVKTSRELRGITEIPSDRSAGIIGMLD
jgi:phosphoribulokinase